MNNEALAKWALGDDTGASSTCIARHLSGLKSDGSYPHDGGDFGRCERLLDAVPELRARLPEMAKVNAYWAALVPRWDDIKAAQDKYKMIQSIVRPIEDKDSRVLRFGKNATIRFGKSI